MKRRVIFIVIAVVVIALVGAFAISGQALRAADDGFQTTRKTGSPSGPARAFVDAESPATVFAFEPAVPGSGTRPVIVHYFPPFPLTIGRYDPPNDYYETQYLRPEGEKGKYAARGGYLRQRPLPGPAASDQIASDLRIELARAARIGVDVFGVDLLSLDGKVERAVPGLLDAVVETDPRFRIAIEPDMNGLRKITREQLVDYLLKFGKHRAAFRDERGRLVVMPFRAEARSPEFWRQVVNDMAAAGEPIAFIPDFVDPSGAGSLADISAAVTRWGSRDARAGLAQRVFGARMTMAGFPAWIAAAAPQDFRPKYALVQEAEGSRSFTEAIKAGIDGNASGLHILTWNDYSEASELQPGSATRFAYYDIAAYYIAWFKAGKPPRIVRDGFVGLHRKQLFRPSDATRGKPWKHRGLPLVDIVEMTAFLTAPATLEITSGGKTSNEEAEAGVHRFTAQAAVGPVEMRVKRAGKTVAYCRSPWTIEAAPSRHDPIYAGFSSLRGCR